LEFFIIHHPWVKNTVAAVSKQLRVLTTLVIITQEAQERKLRTEIIWAFLFFTCKRLDAAGHQAIIRVVGSITRKNTLTLLAGRRMILAITAKNDIVSYFNGCCVYGLVMSRVVPCHFGGCRAIESCALRIVRVVARCHLELWRVSAARLLLSCCYGGPLQACYFTRVAPFVQ
jgi:hypothetical protein